MTTFEKLRANSKSLAPVKINDELTVYVRKLTSREADGITAVQKARANEPAAVISHIAHLAATDIDGVPIFASRDEVYDLDTGTVKAISEAAIEHSGLAETSEEKKTT